MAMHGANRSCPVNKELENDLLIYMKEWSLEGTQASDFLSHKDSSLNAMPW